MDNTVPTGHPFPTKLDPEASAFVPGQSFSVRVQSVQPITPPPFPKQSLPKPTPTPPDCSWDDESQVSPIYQEDANQLYHHEVDVHACIPSTNQKSPTEKTSQYPEQDYRHKETDRSSGDNFPIQNRKWENSTPPSSHDYSGFKKTNLRQHRDNQRFADNNKQNVKSLPYLENRRSHSYANAGGRGAYRRQRSGHRSPNSNADKTRKENNYTSGKSSRANENLEDSSGKRSPQPTDVFRKRNDSGNRNSRENWRNRSDDRGNSRDNRDVGKTRELVKGQQIPNRRDTRRGPNQNQRKFYSAKDKSSQDQKCDGDSPREDLEISKEEWASEDSLGIDTEPKEEIISHPTNSKVATESEYPPLTNKPGNVNKEATEVNRYENNKKGSELKKNLESMKWQNSKREREKLNKSDSSAVRQSNSAFKGRRSEGNYESLKNVDDESQREFDIWKKHETKIVDFKKITEIQGDIFEQPKDYSLAHCVAEDLRMGSGIAVNFKREFKGLPELFDQKAKQGGLAILRFEGRFIYYLVTKRESTQKPTLFNLWKSLCKMRDHIKENEVKKLAIPRLGCGLDRLEWTSVKTMIEWLFKDLDIDIKVCNFQQNELIDDKKTKCKLFSQDIPVTKIEPGTLILYLATSDSQEDEVIQLLSQKFAFWLPFKQQKSKNLGDIIYYDDNSQNFGVCGCIVRATSRDSISFKSLHKCLLEINKMNKKYGTDAFQYVAFQTVNEDTYHDSLINQKITTMLTNYLRNVDVYVCRGSDS